MARSSRQKPIIRTSCGGTRYPYVFVNDRPKLAKLKRAYPQLWKA